MTQKKKIDEECFRKLYNSGFNDTQIARELGFCVSTIWDYRRKLGLPLVKERKQYNDSILMELYHKGYNDKQIAKEQKVDPKIIFRWRKRYKLPANMPAKINGYSLEEDYERILQGESLSNLIPIHAERIKAFRQIEGKDMLVQDKVRYTGLSKSAIRSLTRVYERHSECCIATNSQCESK